MYLSISIWVYAYLFCAVSLRNVLCGTTACTLSTSMVRFVNFDFEMCFAPQRRALYRHRSSQKWSKHGALCKFWLQNVLRATLMCLFLTSQLLKVVRPRCVCYILTSTCTSRDNGVQFFISPKLLPVGSAPTALASLLFNFPEPQIIGKNQNLATFLPCRASASSLFWLFLFHPLLSSTLFFSLPLPRLCLSFVHIVGSLTSRLPSIMARPTRAKTHTEAKPEAQAMPKAKTVLPRVPLHCSCGATTDTATWGRFLYSIRGEERVAEGEKCALCVNFVPWLRLIWGMVKTRVG